LEIEDFWGHKGRIILKFVGVESINDAQQLAGAEIQILSSDRAELEAGANYTSDLTGCLLIVLEGEFSRELGRVTDVQFGAGEAPLLVVRNEAVTGEAAQGAGKGEKEYLIPYAVPYLKSVDTAGKRIVMSLPEGMLEIDSPLSREEKLRQQGGES
jgi:16S rRNA processing protein RimM